MYDDLPDRALSIRQPWAFLIVNRWKPIENRSRRTHYRGPVAIHASLTGEDDVWLDLVAGRHPVTGDKLSFSIDTGHKLRPAGSEYGGIVGVADIVDCVEESNGDWFVGPYGYVLANQRRVPFIPCKGALGFFKWKDRIINE